MNSRRSQSSKFQAFVFDVSFDIATHGVVNFANGSDWILDTSEAN